MNYQDELKKVASGTHNQFYLDDKTGKVMCKCGKDAVQFRDFFLCSSTTVKTNCKY